jgi:hypothetical protein
VTRGGSRPGSGQPPVAGQPKRPHTIGATEAQWAEIRAAVPEDEPVGPWVIDAALMRARKELT